MADKIPHNVGRIDHIVFVVHPETADGAAERFEQVLGISFTDRYEVPAIGIRLYIDWSAGIEIVTPVDRSLAVEYAEHLDKYGEGIFRLVFGVANLDASLERVQSLGLKVHKRFDVLTIRPQWTELFSRLDESIIDAVHGVRLNLGQIEPR
jgi:hypothetical protein